VGTAALVTYSGSPGRWVFEARYNSGTNNVLELANNVVAINQAPPLAIATGPHFDMGSAGDRTVAATYFYGGLYSADAGDHTAAYNNIVAFMASRSPSPSIGPLDLAYFPMQTPRML
jgi:hypothetical protein